MNKLYEAIAAKQDPAKVPGLSRFFKTGPGQYGEGDVFLGIKVPDTRLVVKELWKESSLKDIEECICSKYHEVRLGGLLTLVQYYKHHKNERAEIVDFYLSHTEFINNWDLVDLSCYEILGAWLVDKSDRSVLYNLAANGKTIWERRIGIVSTMALTRKGQFDDTYAIADIFLSQDGTTLHDLLQKAVGWLLRDAGERGDINRLRTYINQHVSEMPRTMLRYAIEKFPEEERQEILKR